MVEKKEEEGLLNKRNNKKFKVTKDETRNNRKRRWEHQIKQEETDPRILPWTIVAKLWKEEKIITVNYNI